MSQENQSPSEQPTPYKKQKKGTLLMERKPSILKTNRDLERRGNLVGKLNFYLALILLFNAFWATWTVTRTVQPSSVYVQYYSEAGIMTPIESVSKTALPPPRARVINQTSQLDLPVIGMEAILPKMKPLAGEVQPASGN